jgi:hypothetical protein
MVRHSGNAMAYLRKQSFGKREPSLAIPWVEANIGLMRTCTDKECGGTSVLQKTSALAGVAGLAFWENGGLERHQSPPVSAEIYVA